MAGEDNPTTDAVRTGVLSKRWQHLWHSCITNLNFTNIYLEDLSSVYKFNESLTKILSVRMAEHNPITSFYLDILYAARPTDIIIVASFVAKT
ncbi:hypothetical protein TSUD_02450 [Trifolium subterraneum]|uniref:Uncharacterized protein n=1 Tax=Trifolium subterraneum TaxID=3900 RepID=A0A2Z6M9W2_TRISU|nr:hypothetical protein TSUD_02450 [Trifolium subterraneum]